jgi:hypothetical protein
MFFSQKFTKVQCEKYDLDISKKNSLKKNDSNSPKFEEKEKSKLPILYDDLQ